MGYALSKAKKKRAVFLVTRPTLLFTPDPKVFIDLPENKIINVAKNQRNKFFQDFPLATMHNSILQAQITLPFHNCMYHTQKKKKKKKSSDLPTQLFSAMLPET